MSAGLGCYEGGGSEDARSDETDDGFQGERMVFLKLDFCVGLDFFFLVDVCPECLLDDPRLRLLACLCVGNGLQYTVVFLFFRAVLRGSFGLLVSGLLLLTLRNLSDFPFFYLGWCSFDWDFRLVLWANVF